MTVTDSEYAEWLEEVTKQLKGVEDELTPDQTHAIENMIHSLDPLRNIIDLNPNEALIAHTCLITMLEVVWEAMLHEDFDTCDAGMETIKAMINDISKEPDNDREV